MRKLSIVIALGMVGLIATTGCGSTPATSINVNVTAPTNDTTNNTVSTPTNDTSNDANSTSSGGSGANTTTSNETGNQSANDTGTDSSSGDKVSITIKSSDDGFSIVKNMYASVMMKDKNFHIDFDHTEQDSGHTVYAYHVYDQMPSSQATIAWVGVRDDGKVKDMITGTDWVSPSEFKIQK